jgi:hypothetical protein
MAIINYMHEEKYTVRRKSPTGNFFVRLLNRISWMFFFMKFDVVYSFGKIITLSDISGVPMWLLMWIFRCRKIIFVNSPSGCLDEEPKTFWKARDNGLLCGNCAFESKCNEDESLQNIEIANRYRISIAGTGSNPIARMQFVKQFHSRSINLSIYTPDLKVPKEFQWRDDKKFNLMHNFMSNSRGDMTRNVKGSHYVSAAVSNLANLGYEINYRSLVDIQLNEMRFWQVQADLIVDQLLYGWWGSTTLEALALGVPVICYLDDDFLSNFKFHFPEIEIPVINANHNNIQDVLKYFILNPTELLDLKIKSRIFATYFLDPEKNVEDLIRFFEQN